MSDLIPENLEAPTTTTTKVPSFIIEGRSIVPSDAISLIIKAGHGALMGKVDIKSAYRIIPVHPSDHVLAKWVFTLI
jgi:hypothetical protein